MESFVTGLKCRECGAPYPKEPLAICSECFGPLEVVYDYDRARQSLTKEEIARRPASMWRYRELLPVDGEPAAGKEVGFTPLVRAKGLEREWGCSEIYIKNDAVNYPTLSFKDRVVSAAISKAVEFGFEAVGCASTGNLANSVAAQSAQVGLPAYVLIPADLEEPKVIGTLVFGPTLVGIEGNYDQVNRLCSELADKYGWGFVNVNLRPYYGEGSKSMGFEIAEQLGWRAPKHMVVPMAGGSLITKLEKSLRELGDLGLIEKPDTKFYGAQPEGCAPIVNLFHSGTEDMVPVKPKTIVKSLAIGDPADGIYAARVMRGSGGNAGKVSDDEVVEGIRLLARTEGIFTETAGGVTVSVAKKLIDAGTLPKNESIVLAITGNGLKTQEVIAPGLKMNGPIEPSLDAFVDWMDSTQAQAAAS